MSEEKLSFTGERFLPDCEREIWYEHYHRYAMIVSLVEGKDVLDAACGEGYGSNLLANKAKNVTGVDIDATAIKHANTHYKRTNLQYIKQNVLELDFPENKFDVVVSFETLEHLAEHDELIQNFKRVLKPDGILIISSPDKSEYSDKTGFINDFHVKELYRDELEQLIDTNFNHKEMFGQKLTFNSSIWKLDKTLESVQYDCMSIQHELVDKPPFEPMYYIVLASDEPILKNNIKDYLTFTEQQETVYGHYNAVIRAHIKYENKYNELKIIHDRWLEHPIIGRFIKWFKKD